MLLPTPRHHYYEYFITDSVTIVPTLACPWSMSWLLVVGDAVPHCVVYGQ